MGVPVKWPCRIHVDNDSGISFQKATTPNSKLKGVFDLRWNWIKELRDNKRVQAVPIDTTKNIADLFTKCLSASTIRNLINEVRKRAKTVANAV